MKTQLILLSLMMGAIAVPLTATASGRGIARAAEAEMPRNQSEFDRFAARFDNLNPAERTAQLNRAGNAFDNGESRLFWFTDLDAARAQAKREGKPILSLRLLGNLSDELSCANSRLFRVLIYPNVEINRQLRENFVLHWSSERPVPVATIDMGDGRVFKRTLTGNSAHYLLSADGMPLDALAGLYAPAEFAAWLQRGAKFARDWQAMNVDSRPKMLGDWHRGRLIEGVKAQPGGDLKWAQSVESEVDQIIATNFLASGKPAPQSVPARDISSLAYSKGVGELPILRAADTRAMVLTLGENSRNFLVPLAPQSGNVFRPGTITSPSLFDAATRTRIATMQLENDPQVLIQTLETNVARDTRNNKNNFEPAIHAYFVNQSAPNLVDNEGFSTDHKRTNPYLSDESKSSLTRPEPFGARKNSQFGDPTPTIPANRETANETKPDFVQLNRAIYDKLFRTPASDPWLGLSPADAFVAIQNGGVQNAQTSQQRAAQQP